MLTNTGFKKTLAIIFSVHPHLEPNSGQDFVYKAWFQMLRDFDDDSLIQAATRFVMEVPKLFPGDNFIAQIRQLARPTLQETEGDAVELAFAAASKFGGYRENEAMAWLNERSPLIAAVVRRVGFRDICNSCEPDVIRGQLRSIFKSEKERAKQVGGIVESAEHLSCGLPDERILSLLGGRLKLTEGKK